MRKNLLWISSIIVAFAIIYGFSLTFTYIEGDDASSIAYHALGRNADLQPPYSPYHSLMDEILRLFPENAKTLITVAMIITSISTVVMTILMLWLVFDWLNISDSKTRLMSALVVLLAIPELFYLGLVYTPSVFAMAWVLAAHLVLRAGTRKSDKLNNYLPVVFVSSLLFGIGAAARWDIVTYGAVIAVDLMLLRLHLTKDLKQSLSYGVMWGVTALVMWLVVLQLTGYSIGDIFGVGEFGTQWIVSLSFVTFAKIQTLLTPGTIILGGFGLVALWKQNRGYLLILIVSILIVAPWITTGIPKILLPAFPAIVVSIVAGLMLLTRLMDKSRLPSAYLSGGLIVVLLGAWLIGIHYSTTDSQWGPGFELRPYDDRTSVPISFAFASSVAVPTSEGPRPLFGYAIPLLGGEWRHLARQNADEQKDALQYAIADGLPFMQDSGSGYAVASLSELGFTTADPHDNTIDNFIVRRRFESDTDTVVMYRLKERSNLFDCDGISRLMQYVESSTIVIYGYSSTLSDLYDLAPLALDQLGNVSAILDLRQLHDAACSNSD